MASRTSTLILFCLILASFAFAQMTMAANLKGFMYFKPNTNDDLEQPDHKTAKGFANFRENSNEDPKEPDPEAKGLVHVRPPKGNDPPEAKGLVHVGPPKGNDPPEAKGLVHVGPPKGNDPPASPVLSFIPKGVRPKTNSSPASSVPSSVAKELRPKSNGSSASPVSSSVTSEDTPTQVPTIAATQFANFWQNSNDDPKQPDPKDQAKN